MKKVTIILGSVLALAACAQEVPQTTQSVPSPTISAEDNVMGGSLSRVQFEEGTTCYLVDSYKAGALSCDFSQSTSGAGQAGVLESASGLRLLRTAAGDICAVYDGYQASGLECKFN